MKHQETLSLVGLWGVLESQRATYWEDQKKKKKTQIACLTITPSGEVAQMLTSAISKWGLSREVQAALLKVRTGPECPEDNLRELT